MSERYEAEESELDATPGERRTGEEPAGVVGRVVGPPLDESDLADLEDLAREEVVARLVAEAERATDGVEGDAAGDGLDPGALAEAIEEGAATEAAEVGDAAEAGDATEATEVIEAGDATEVIEAGDATEVIEAIEAGDAAEATEVIEAGDAAEATEVIEAGEAAEAVPEPEPFVLCRFIEVAMVLPSTSPVLVLEEEQAPEPRQLRIPIGTPEGVAIAYAAKGIGTPRPLSHELFAQVLEAFSLTIDAVRITEVRGNAYAAELVCSGPSGTRTFSCRPSDAVALSLRQRLPAPILASPEVLAVAGVGGGND